jgi:hypothetical protein
MFNIRQRTLKSSKTICQQRALKEYYLQRKRILPTVHNTTNFLGFATRTGINRKAITKHAAAPRTQHPNTTNLSH